MSQIRLEGDLAMPERPGGTVLVIVQRAIERGAPAPIQLADYLHHFNFATLLVAIECGEEVPSCISIERAASRVGAALAWSERHPLLGPLPVGLLGLGDAVVPTLLAGAYHVEHVSAIVGAGGRPDLAGPLLAAVTAPTLLLAGANARSTLGAARAALRALHCRAELAVIEESEEILADPAARGSICHLAHTWFTEHLVTPVS